MKTPSKSRAKARSILRFENHIAGKWSAKGTGTLEVQHKYTGAKLASLPLATGAQVERAIAAAHRIAPEFARWSAAKRRDHLQRLRDLLAEHRAAFVDLIVAEAGKPRDYAEGELARCLSTLDTATAESVRFGGEVVPLDYDAGEGRTAFTRRVPVGVVTAITPFNFPLNLVLHKLAPALALGCPVLLKPALQTPLTALAFQDLVVQAGYPAGVLSTFVCANEHAEQLVVDERIKFFSFTGSDTVGWYLKSRAGKKKVALELGGNAAVIVDASADLELAAAQCAVGAFLYAGQICISTQRIFVVEEVAERFEKLLVKAIRKLRTGDPNASGVQVGPLIDGGHVERIASWVREAKASGARVLAGGRIADKAHNVYQPTLLADVPREAKVCTEEAFGPVAILERVPDFDAALERTNDSRFGLQAGVFTNAFAHVKRAHEELEVGGVIVNSVPGFRVDSMPYGGVKDSGLGREGLRYAMEEMSEPRLLVY